MKVLDLLASTQSLKGSEANIVLAQKLAASENHEGIKDLVENLLNKDKRIQSDCIKTLYEIGYIKPRLISEYYKEFLKILTSKNNRLVWGGMIALATIADLKQKEIFTELKLIMQTIKKGSVITVDAGIEILAKLNSSPDYFNTVDPLLSEQLWKCPVKQLPMYLERSQICISKKNKEIYLSIIEKRMHECDRDSQKKRLEKVKKQINKV
jgi:hypothetical protein